MPMAKPEITKATLAYLAQLARIKLDPQEEERLLGDLRNIVDYVEELQNADTAGVAPMNGGTLLMNIFREDGTPESTHRAAGTEQFPETKDGYLKIPPVFGGEGSSANS
jgi:aspartyl-tRNA(Asn)/glutamyl-tRNA(Gln) amidotransferase subunit C